MRLGFVCCLAVGLAACSKGRPDARPIDPPSHDAGSPPLSDAGPQPDAGTDGAPVDAGPDAGSPDAGTTDAGAADGGSDGGPLSDGGQPGELDAGPASDGGSGDGGITTDGGSSDGGADGGVTTPPLPDAHKIGGLGAGPWPLAGLTTYGGVEGLHEAAISATTDEAQNIWVVTQRALYVLAPGEARFRRYTAADGLHVGPGWTEFPDFMLVIGGGTGKGQGECFVGYYAHDTHDKPGTKPEFAHTENDPVAHLGKMDQVLVRADRTLEVRRYDFHNTNNGFYYETRTIISGLYDHFQHPGELYIGSNHGVVRVLPDKWRLPQTPSEKSWPISVEREWYADHVHPRVCQGGSCEDPTRAVSFGDFFGLALADDGRLWMGGLSSAGALHWKQSLFDWYQSYRPINPFDPAFGDPYPGNPPVFLPPREGDFVNIRAIAPAPDGTVWFASGEVEGWRGPTYGLAAWDGKRFTYVDPIAIGAADHNVLELVALPDGRLVLGFPDSGLLVWRPGEAKGHRLTTTDGLPGNRIGRMYLDRMVEPPALYVPTEGGLAVFRAIPSSPGGQKAP